MGSIATTKDARVEPALIGWWCRRYKLSVAGVRIRAHQVMCELRRQGHAVEWFDAEHADRYRAVVLHKHYDAAARAQAEQLKQAGTRVVFDLCDNHFYNPKGLPEWRQRAQDLRQMAELADAVVVSTAALAEIVAAECALKRAPIIVRDALDNLDSVPVPLKHRIRQALPAQLLMRRVRAARDQGRLPLLWFGHHGRSYAEGGMLDLLRIRSELETLNPRLPLHLTVLSNQREKFDANFRDWTFPVTYGTWNPQHFGDIARLHAIALIPAQDNPFTRVKSENRVVTAFAHGLAVVADPIPSYRAFSDALCFGDWARSIERYGSDAALRLGHVEAGRQRSLELCGIEPIARRWLAVIAP